jgi:hypothetical protein
MTTSNHDPRLTPGQRGGGGVPPEETPPAEESIHGIAYPEPAEVRKAWGAAPLILILAVAVLIAMVVELSL